MPDDPERQVLDQLLQDAALGNGDLAGYLNQLVARSVGRQTDATPLPVTVNLLRFVADGDTRLISMRLVIVSDGKPIERILDGQCRFRAPEVLAPSVVLWEHAAPCPPLEIPTTFAAQTRGWKLQYVALLVGVLLAAMTIVGAIGCLLAADAAARSNATLIELIVLTAAAGWTGACGAALRSMMVRYSHGFEYDELDEHGQLRRSQWPSAPDGTERFSALIAPTFLGRPLLGLVVGPIAYFVTQTGASVLLAQPPATAPDSLALMTAIAVSALSGMFVKSIWENLNERSTKLFK